MLRLSKVIYQLPMLLTILNLLSSSTHAIPTFHVSQIPSLSTDLSPRPQPLHSTATTLANHPKRAMTKGTFLNGLWAFAITTTTFFFQGPSSSSMPASNIEYFAQEILDEIATRIASGAAEISFSRWALDGVSISFSSWPDSGTLIAPTVPWAVVQEFVTRMVLWRAERGMVVAFWGNIWGPGRYNSGRCVSSLFETRARVTEQIEGARVLSFSRELRDQSSPWLGEAMLTLIST